MRQGALLLPLFLLCQTIEAINARREHQSSFREDDCGSITTLKSSGELPYTPTTPFWLSLGQFLSKHLPGDASSTESGFFNDLQLALNPPIAGLGQDRRDDLEEEEDSCTLERRTVLYPRDQRILKTKCRIKPTQPHSGWDDDEIPNYTPTDSEGHPLPTQTIGDGHGGYGQEIIAVKTLCNGHIPPNATVTTSGGSGPNGQFTWLTCGIDPNNNSSGWQPPHATVDQIITFPGGLRAAVQDPNSPFSACTRFVELFETAGAEFQVPPLYIAAFALQESGCNPDVDGGGGEQGMMQISPEKCHNAPDGNCKDIVYNVRTAVSYFRDVLQGANNNAFEAVGNYNGWFRGMSYAEAVTWGINGDCCRCQRNLSYLFQFFNGWLQNINAWSPPLGLIHNTNICD